MVLNKQHLFLCLVIILHSNKHVKTPNAAIIKNTVDPLTCYNPNKQLGVCISIYDCVSLRHILQHKLENLYNFVRASVCQMGSGKPPFVCCTKDVKFRDVGTMTKHRDRIIFPDEFERSKRIGLKNEKIMLTSTTVSTNNVSQTIATEKVFKENKTLPLTTTMKSTLGKEIQNVTEASILNTATKFPKPPNCGSITIANKIYGGRDAELGEFSWMVILEYRNFTTGKLIMDCGGSIINERYVLTAAHCVKGDILIANGRLEAVRIGEHNTDTKRDCNEKSCISSFQRISIESSIPHENYNTKTYFGARNQHDIALLRLKETIKFNKNLKPACLPNVVPLTIYKDETKFTASGWGHNGTTIRTAIKQKVELPFVKHEECRQKYSKKFFLTDEQLCAGGRFREDSCNGDSGGPLMRLNKDFWILEGIVSFGLGCGLERPGIYTNLRHYLDWIDKHVKSD